MTLKSSTNETGMNLEAVISKNLINEQKDFPDNEDQNIKLAKQYIWNNGEHC